MSADQTSLKVVADTIIPLELILKFILFKSFNTVKFVMNKVLNGVFARFQKIVNLCVFRSTLLAEEWLEVESIVSLDKIFIFDNFLSMLNLSSWKFVFCRKWIGYRVVFFRYVLYGFDELQNKFVERKSMIVHKFSFVSMVKAFRVSITSCQPWNWMRKPSIFLSVI